MKRVSNPNPPVHAKRPKAPPAPPKVMGGYNSNPDKLDTVYYKSSPQYFTYYLDDDIVEPFQYRELFQLLESMNEGDHLTIYINCYGGFLHTTTALVNAVNTTQGHVHTVLNGVACSGGGLVFMSGHSCEVYPHSTFMAHSSLGGVGYQKLPDTTKRIEHDNRQLKTFYHDVYKYFMSVEEIDKMLEGYDFWFDTDELNIRLAKRFAKLTEEAQAAQKAQEDSLNAMFDELDPVPPEAVLKQVRKDDLIRYITGEVDITVDDNGKSSVVPFENDE